MPETTKSYSNLEILQGAQYETTFTLSTGHSVSSKSYVATIRKELLGDEVYRTAVENLKNKVPDNEIIAKCWIDFFRIRINAEV